MDIVKNFECKGERVGDYLYDKKTDTISYDLKYPFPCKFKVQGLQHITVTPMMKRLPSFLKYHNIDWLEQQLMQVNLIKKDKVLIHGAAWQKNGKGYLAVGFPNSGKTTRIVKEMADGAKFCSDENVILYPGGFISYVIRASCVDYRLINTYGIKIKKKAQIALYGKRFLSKFIPFIEPAVWIDLPYRRYNFHLDELIFFNNAKGKDLLLLTDNEFPWYTNPVIQAYAYATGFDIRTLYKKYVNLIDNVSSYSKS